MRRLDMWCIIGVVVVAATLGALIAGRPSSANSDSLPAGITAPPTSAPIASTTTTPPAEQPHLQVAVIGDSYTGGSPMGGTEQANWVAVMDRALRADGHVADFQVVGLGGSGYVNLGQTSETFDDGVPRAVRANTNLVIFFGSRNDAEASLAAVEAAARTTFTAARAIAPDAALLVIGAPWVNESVPTEIAALNNGLGNVAAEFDGRFINPVNDRWFFDVDSDLIGSDGVHPTDDGHAYMAERIAPIVAEYFG